MSFQDGIGPRLERGFSLDDAVGALEDAAGEVLAYARDNAPWNDRTGAARAGLSVEVYEEAGEIVLELFHTVDYGEWLEVIQNGQFATIMPTLEVFATQIFNRTGATLIGGGFEE